MARKDRSVLTVRNVHSILLRFAVNYGRLGEQGLKSEKLGLVGQGFEPVTETGKKLKTSARNKQLSLIFISH